MLLRKLLGATLATTAMVFVLGACGGGEDTTDAPPTPDVPDVDVPDVDMPDVDMPDEAEMLTYECACGKEKTVAADAPAPS